MALGFRPTLELDLACSSRDALDRVCRHFATTNLLVRRTRPPGGGRDSARDADHVVITLPEAQRQFWSPWLTIEIEPVGAGAHVLAKFSPHPSVWTGFMFGYLALGLVAAVAATIGASALALGSAQSWAWWFAGGAALAMLGMWIASQIGQRLAHDQMAVMREELEVPLEISKRAPVAARALIAGCGSPPSSLPSSH